MNTKNCAKCNIQPTLKTDEFGITYRLECEKCGKSTMDIISPSSSIHNPQCDDETTIRLIADWNNIN